jgi:hypothetical protein
MAEEKGSMINCDLSYEGSIGTRTWLFRGPLAWTRLWSERGPLELIIQISGNFINLFPKLGSLGGLKDPHPLTASMAEWHMSCTQAGIPQKKI